jgi:hypothetical protein
MVGKGTGPRGADEAQAVEAIAASASDAARYERQQIRTICSEVSVEEPAGRTAFWRVAVRRRAA